MLLEDDAMLDTREAAEALQKLGLKVSKATLETMRSRGGGPPYQKFGMRAIYQWRTTRAWAESRISAPVTTASELRASQQAA